MSLNEGGYPVQHDQVEKMIIKKEASDDDQFIESGEDDSLLLISSAKLKCEGEQNDSSCERSSELNNFVNTFAPFAVKQEPEVLSTSSLKEEIDVEEHKPGWERARRSGRVGMFNDGLALCDSVQESELRSSECRSEVEAKSSWAHCSDKTNQKSIYSKHKQPVKVYKCNECSHETKYEHSLILHFKLKHSKEPAQVFKCQECSHETKYKRVLTAHFKLKHSKEPAQVFKCQECSHETKYKSDLTRHYKWKHSTDSEVYKCQECAYETKNKYHFTQHHKLKHSKDAEVYKCQECSYETKNKSNLTKHKRRHKKRVVNV